MMFCGTMTIIGSILSRLATGVLDLVCRLVDRRVVGSARCPLCFRRDETIVHAIWGCKSMSSIRSEFHQFELLAVVWWRIWFRRNKLTRQECPFPVAGLVSWCKSFLFDFQSAGFAGFSSSTHLHAVPRDHTWRPLDTSLFKINSDAALDSNWNQVGLEYVVCEMFD
ncbi:hypothetical protein ACOSQ3_004822 [Xanthoceras sorbifolium]